MHPALNSLLRLALSLLPVIAFLIVLVALDSYKLLRLRSILFSVLAGCASAVAALWLETWLTGVLPIERVNFVRYVGPVCEETLKAIFLVVLIWRKRVGFMVDASIHGFAIGAGFAIIENIHYFTTLSDPNLLLWMVRGFGTAIMHGGVTAIAGILFKQSSDRSPQRGMLNFVPGLIVALVMHSFYNHFIVSPLLSTFAVLVTLPLITLAVFRTSESATRRWLGLRMDTDAELLEMINTGRVTQSRAGRYLLSLKTRFPGEVVADMLCLLKLHLELSIRAKGILLMREAGFKVNSDPEVQERFDEMKYLEESIGKTGLLAITPIFHMSDHDLWQLYMLGKK